jgi:hypothetical protein
MKFLAYIYCLASIDNVAFFPEDPCDSSPCGHDEDCLISTADLGKQYVCVKSINFCERMKPCNNRSECIYFKKNNTFYCRCLNGATSCNHEDVEIPTTQKPAVHHKKVAVIVPNNHISFKKKHEKVSDKGSYKIIDSLSTSTTKADMVFTWQVNYTVVNMTTATSAKDTLRISNAESEIPKFGFNHDNVILKFYLIQLKTCYERHKSDPLQLLRILNSNLNDRKN